MRRLPGSRPHRKLVRNALDIYRERGFSRWLGKGFWAIVDRGLFATSNFVLTVLLARWLTPQDYGAFIVAYTVLWLLGTVHNGLLAEPMLVFGSGRYKDSFSEYLGVLLYGHVGLTALGSFLLLLAALSFKLASLDTLFSVFLGLAFASPLILYQWLMRQACYVQFKPRLAAWGGTLYMFLMLCGAYVLYRYYLLSGAAVFGLMGFASLAASLWLVFRLRVSLPSPTANGFVREALTSHWGYGRWAAPTRALTWIPENIYYLALPLWGGLESTAALRAMMNLIVPATHLYDALSILLLPLLVRTRGGAGFKQLTFLALALFALGAALFWLFLGLFHQPLVTLLYGGQYSEYSYLLWILGFLLLSFGILSVLGAALRALERPEKVFSAYALSAVVALTVGLGFLYIWGIVGAVAGFLISSIVAVGALAWLLFSSKPTTKVESIDHEVSARDVQ